MSKINRGKLEATNFNTKFPEKSPYNTAKHSGAPKPTSEQLRGAKKAEFEG